MAGTENSATGLLVGHSQLAKRRVHFPLLTAFTVSTPMPDQLATTGAAWGGRVYTIRGASSRKALISMTTPLTGQYIPGVARPSASQSPTTGIAPALPR